MYIYSMKTIPQMVFIVSLTILIMLASAGQTYKGGFNLFSSNYRAHGPYVFPGNGGDDNAEFRLIFDNINSVTQLLMQVKTNNATPTSDDTKIATYAHKNPNSSSMYDLQHSNSGQMQVVSVGGLVPNAQLYIFVINFNSLLISNYTIDVTERRNYNPNYCLNRNPLSPNSIYCSSCVNPMYYGAFCDISNSMLANNIVYNLVLYGWNDSRGNFGTMTIPANSSQFTLYYSATVINVIAAIQLKNFNSEVAGLMNFADNGLRSLSQYNTQYSVSINTGGTYDISLSFLNLNPYSVTLSVWFISQPSTNILVIVLAVLGGILFIGLVVVATCIIRRMRNPQNPINPLSSMMVQANNLRINNASDLSLQEIQTYFPSVLCKNIINEQQNSSNNLTAQRQKEGDRDCVICLCPVVSSEMIKVTYCRHIFHAQCLNKWFQKQRVLIQQCQNCPYCREEYNKNSTMQHYQSLLNSTHKNILAGVDLAKEILLLRHKSNVVIEQFKG